MELNEQIPVKPPRTSTSSEIIPQKKPIDLSEVEQIAEEAMAAEETREEVEEKPNVQRLPLKSDSSEKEQPKNYALRKSKSREIIRIPRASSKMDVSAEETKSDGKPEKQMSSALDKNEGIKAEETEKVQEKVELEDEQTPKIEIKTKVDSEIEHKNVENNETKPDIPTPVPRKNSPKEEEIEDTTGESIYMKMIS